MAEKRMFAMTIIDSDAFLEMPQSTQLLYFHLSMRADDDGFINKPKTIMRMACCKDDDMRILISKKFIIPFENGIVVIKHWKIHNYIAKDRYTETKYKDEKALLTLDENKAYHLENSDLYTDCIQVVDEMTTQVRLGKISKDIDKTYCAFFEQIWKLYPNKKGKGQVSDAKKKELFKISIEEMTRSIERYKTELKKDEDWRKPQNGSTFFNSGYVDYLDANYVPGESKPKPQPKTTNKFNQFPQRDYAGEMDSMEQRLISKGLQGR